VLAIGRPSGRRIFLFCPGAGDFSDQERPAGWVRDTALEALNCRSRSPSWSDLHLLMIVLIGIFLMWLLYALNFISASSPPLR